MDEGGLISSALLYTDRTTIRSLYLRQRTHGFTFSSGAGGCGVTYDLCELGIVNPPAKAITVVAIPDLCISSPRIVLLIVENVATHMFVCLSWLVMNPSSIVAVFKVAPNLME